MFDQPDSTLDQLKNLILVVKFNLKKFYSFERVVFVVGMTLGLALASYGGWRVAAAGVVEYRTPATTLGEGEIPLSAPPQLVVEVAGAVASPGVYTLPVGSRVAQAVTAAGSPTIDADRGYLTKELNLAQELTDQQKIYLPFIGESSLGNVIAGEGSALEPVIGSGISVNTATAAELMELDGIGEKRAADIIAGRPYQSIDQLVTKKIITESQWQNLQSQVKL